MNFDFIFEPKVQMLSEITQRRYFMIVASGKILSDEQASFMMRISLTEWENTKSFLMNAGLIDQDNKPSMWKSLNKEKISPYIKKHPKYNDALEILEFLNEISQQNFQVCDTNLTFIVQRLNEYTPKQLRQVIIQKNKEWKDDPITKKWIRPATLFNKTKCSQYVGSL